MKKTILALMLFSTVCQAQINRKTTRQRLEEIKEGRANKTLGLLLEDTNGVLRLRDTSNYLRTIISGTSYRFYSQKPVVVEKTDTVPCIMLLIDTAHRYVPKWEFHKCKEEGCINVKKNHDHFKTVKIDYGNDSSGNVVWMQGYSIRKNFNQNQMSNGDWYCGDCKDYMKHESYLDKDKNQLKPTVIVWMSK